MQDISKKRYYAHGDLHEDIPNLHYYAKCDVFEPPSHFDEPSHIKNRQERYNQSLSDLKRLKNYFRPKNTKNIVAIYAKADKKAQSPFFNWLLRQLKRDDPIGDLANDVRGDSKFPKTAVTREIIRSYIAHNTHVSREALVAFDEGWDEFKTKSKIREGISKSLRFAIFKRDFYACRICGTKADNTKQLEIDHIIPVKKGGTNDEDNLWVLCLECNRGKGVSDI